jgi:FAD/FMN-containing dehydrogenase
MSDLQVTTTGGTSTALNEATVQAFTDTLRGELLRPGDAHYDSARTVWNAMIDKRPALIVRCAGVADVISAVKFARTHDVLVSVRGGGHNIAGNSVCADGLMIDLAPMQGIQVDPVHRTARAQAGVKLGALDLETQAFGLATTLGTASDTGIAGLTLGGGYGWLAGKYGMACDNLLSADMVTASGEFVQASETENSELFWGLRGGGGNFGVVTSFAYRLHEVGPVLGGPIFYPFAKAKNVLRFYNEFAATAPDELTTVSGFLTAPDGHLSVAIGVCYCGDLSTGERVIQPLRQIATPTFDFIQPMPYLALQRSFDELFASGRHYYWKSSLLRTLSASAIDVIVECASAIPTPLAVIVMQQLHGTATRVSPTATAFAHRYHHWNFIPHAGWTNGDGDRNIAWVREAWRATQPFLEQAAYVNDLGDEDVDRVPAAYGQNYSRLVALKNQYDPTNFFRLNQNIRPTL